MASDDHFWTCGEVVAGAARMGREPLRSRGYNNLNAYVLYSPKALRYSSLKVFGQRDEFVF